MPNIDLTSGQGLIVANNYIREVIAANTLLYRDPVDQWMINNGVKDAEFLLDFAGNQYGFRSPNNIPRFGSVAGDMTFTRASAAGHWPANGPYEMVSSGVLRYDHDPITRAPLGARIEGGATPISTDTTNFAATGSSWAFGGTAALLVENATSIFSGQVAAKHTVGTVGSSQSRHQFKTVAQNTDYRFEVILERTDLTVAASAFGLLAGSWLGLVAYNWGTGVLSSVFGSPSGYIVENLGIGPNGGELVRCSAIANSGTATSAALYIYPLGFSSTAGQSCILHYACCTPGTEYRSPVIVGASAVTRAADRLYLDLPFDPATEGITLLWDGILPASFASNPVALAFLRPAGSDLDRLQIYGTQGNFGPIGVYNNGSVWAPAPTWRLFVPGARRRLVMRLTPTGVSMSQNGDAVTTAALSGAIPAGMTRLDIGNLRGALVWGSTIREVAIWKGAPFSDAQMRELSAL